MGYAHGGVVQEKDACVIQIGFLKAHFSVFQPRTQGHRELCEDLPDIGETVFVMTFLHNGLAEMPIDFRIIRDVTGRRRFAKWADITEIADLDAATVFYQPASVDPDVVSVLHNFSESGDYIGIVTARQPLTQQLYSAVFPFRVGSTGFGYTPLIVAALLILQINFWIMSGGPQRWHERRTARKNKAVQT